MRKLTLALLCFATHSLVAVAQETGLDGTWNAIAAVSDGLKIPENRFGVGGPTLTMKAGRYDISRMGEKIQSGTYKIDATKKPAHIDMTFMDEFQTRKAINLLGLYKIEGDKLTLIFHGGAPETNRPAIRPKTFESPKGSGLELNIFTLKK